MSIFLTNSATKELTDTDYVATIKEEVYAPKKIVYEHTGVVVGAKISTTLQGSIYKGLHKETNKECVIKRAQKSLHDKGVGMVNNKLYKVSENIIKEASIMKYIGNKNGAKYMPNLMNFFVDSRNYFLIMEYGGKSLLNHVKLYHKLIKKGKLSHKIWMEHITILFKQMCIFINYLHNDRNVAHLDISLENILIKGCLFKNGKFIKHGKVYFIDFGLAEYFDDDSYMKCNKFCGKIVYQAPRIYAKKIYNAYKADIWSLGVVLFGMAFNAFPYNIPSRQDACFSTIYSGNIKQLINQNDKKKYTNKKLNNLFTKIFTKENKRYNINEILNHKYILN